MKKLNKENDFLLVFLREAEEKGLLSSKSADKVRQFKNKIIELQDSVEKESRASFLADELEDSFNDLLEDLKHDFFSLGEIKNEISQNYK